MDRKLVRRYARAILLGMRIRSNPVLASCAECPFLKRKCEPCTRCEIGQFPTRRDWIAECLAKAMICFGSLTTTARHRTAPTFALGSPYFTTRSEYT